MPVFTNEETKRANKSLSQSCELNTIKEAWEPKTMSSAMLAPSPKPGPPPVSHLCERPTTQQWLKPQALAPPTSMPRFSTLWLKSSPGDLWTLPNFPPQQYYLKEFTMCISFFHPVQSGSYFHHPLMMKALVISFSFSYLTLLF